ncbi:hypothetical protein [Collimonas silvisoli]|uniref:hypothetical protein n=1 Tax=Collimonas silvisoli TaxID=2825884 RepID=UPI001B8BF939|nr:hypothetical protein [Collimonas silvisoli]
MEASRAKQIALAAKIFMKKILCCLALLLSITSVSAQSIAMLTHEIHFAKKSDRISVEEVRALVDWKIEILQRHGLLHYGVYLKTDNRLKVPLRLAEKRLAAVGSLLDTLGFRMEDAAIEDFNVPNAARRLTRNEANTAVVAVQPPCIRMLTCYRIDKAAIPEPQTH